MTLSFNNFIYRNDVENALHTIDSALQKVHKAPGVRIQENKSRHILDSMNNVNKSYKEYQKSMADPTSSDHQRENALNA